MIDKLQSLKEKQNQNFIKNISNYYDNMNIRMNEDPFNENAQGISKIYQYCLAKGPQFQGDK